MSNAERDDDALGTGAGPSVPRRTFLAGSAALVPAVAGGGATAAAAGSKASAPRLLELRLYHLRIGPMEARFSAHAQSSLLPALNRAGVSPVGAFSVMFGPGSPTVYLLLPHESPESFATLEARLEKDDEYRASAQAFLALPSSDPPWVRVDSTLMTPFETAPAIEVPSGPLAVPGRVFELRVYESHSDAAGRKKIEMFEKGGEIAIFRRVGVNPVFFGRNLVGTRMPGLTYLTVYADLAAREKAWAAFRDDPGWKKLSATPGYTNPEVVSNTNVFLLRPTPWSQV